GKTDVASFNDMLYRNGEGLLPAKLLGLQRAPAGFSYQLSMDPEADREDPLRVFQDGAARERLLMPQFSAFFRSEPAKALQGAGPRGGWLRAPTGRRGPAPGGGGPPGGRAPGGGAPRRPRAPPGAKKGTPPPPRWPGGAAPPPPPPPPPPTPTTARPPPPPRR